eukprot:5241971-Heterocapsa_arctica.AAC.1
MMRQGRRSTGRCRRWRRCVAFCADDGPAWGPPFAASAALATSAAASGPLPVIAGTRQAGSGRPRWSSS